MKDRHWLAIMAAACALGALIVSLVSCRTVPQENPCPYSPDGAAESCTQRVVRLPRGAASAWADPSSVWQLPDRTLTVGFLDGSGNQRRMFREVLDIWREVLAGRLNIVLVDGARARTAHVRVSFQCSGHWSFVGRDARHAAEGKATMNIMLSSQPWEEWRRVVLHEFGHALGLRHEHAHPQSGIAWDREAVYRFYAQTQGWDRATVDRQVFTPAPDQWTGTRWDPQSIMHYPVPANLTLDRQAVGWNDDLSPADIAFVHSLYPLP